MILDIGPLGVRLTELAQDGEFWDSDLAINRLQGYFVGGDHVSDRLSIPEGLQIILRDDISAAALGGIASYLRKLNLDSDLVRIGRFLPLACAGIGTARYMTLDAQALSDLHILDCGIDSPSCGNVSSLLRYLGHSKTGFGRR